MVGLPESRSNLKSRPFATLPLFDHSKSRLDWISDPHCIWILDSPTSHVTPECPDYVFPVLNLFSFNFCAAMGWGPKDVDRDFKTGPASDRHRLVPWFERRLHQHQERRPNFCILGWSFIRPQNCRLGDHRSISWCCASFQRCSQQVIIVLILFFYEGQLFFSKLCINWKSIIAKIASVSWI